MMRLYDMTKPKKNFDKKFSIFMMLEVFKFNSTMFVTKVASRLSQKIRESIRIHNQVLGDSHEVLFRFRKEKNIYDIKKLGYIIEVSS